MLGFCLALLLFFSFSCLDFFLCFRFISAVFPCWFDTRHFGLCSPKGNMPTQQVTGHIQTLTYAIQSTKKVAYASHKVWCGVCNTLGEPLIVKISIRYRCFDRNKSPNQRTEILSSELKRYTQIDGRACANEQDGKQAARERKRDKYYG